MIVRSKLVRDIYLNLGKERRRQCVKMECGFAFEGEVAGGTLENQSRSTH